MFKLLYIVTIVIYLVVRSGHCSQLCRADRITPIVQFSCMYVHNTCTVHVLTIFISCDVLMSQYVFWTLVVIMLVRYQFNSLVQVCRCFFF